MFCKVHAVNCSVFLLQRLIYVLFALALLCSCKNIVTSGVLVLPAVFFVHLYLVLGV